MDIILRHGIEYEVNDSVGIEDLIKSLEANARLLRSTGKLIAALVPGLVIEPKRISVVHLSQASPLKEMFAFSVVMTYQKDLEREVPQLIEALTGKAIPDQYDTLVTVLVMLVAIYGISKAFEIMFPGRSPGELTATEHTLLKRASAATGVAAQRIRDALEVLFTGQSKRALVAASQKAFAPTRGQSGAIRTERGEVLVTREAVMEAQAAAGLPYEPEENDAPKSVSEFHSDVRIILHAMDKDRKRIGWAGHVPSLFDDRIQMHLEKSLNPNDIFGKSEIVGDIILTREEDETGNMKPKEFLLIRTQL